MGLINYILYFRS